MQEQTLAVPAVAAAAVHEYFTTDEVAERYRRSPATIRYWRHLGYGPKGTRAGRRVLYPFAEIEKFDRQLAAGAEAEAEAKAFA